MGKHVEVNKEAAEASSNVTALPDNYQKQFIKMTKEIHDLHNQINTLTKNQQKMENMFKYEMKISAQKLESLQAQMSQVPGSKASNTGVKKNRKMPAPSSSCFAVAKCIFCKLGKHDSLGCNIYKYPCERIAIAQNNHICLKCLEPLTNTILKCHVGCPKATKQCTNCKSTNHCVLFCEKPRRDYPFRLICDFCNDRTHDTKECAKFFIGTSASQRKLRLYTENRCFQCFKRNDCGSNRMHAKCSNKMHVCQLCSHQQMKKTTDSHHPLLCEHFYDIQMIADVGKPETKSARSAPY